MSLLHVFDMDGTLLRGTTASLELAREAGLLAELQALEDTFALGFMATHEFATLASGLWRRLEPGAIAKAFTMAPWLDGIPDVMTDIRDRGESSIVVTMSPDFFAARLTTFGVGRVFASRFPLPPVDSELAPSDILTPRDKVSITDRVLAELGIGRDRCVAYGDSASDLPLFETLPKTVAVNAGRALCQAATVAWVGSDLRDAYRLGRSIVEEDRCPRTPSEN